MPRFRPLNRGRDASGGGRHTPTHIGVAVAQSAAQPAATTSVAQGARIAGYEIVGPLGRGGMGVVYRAHHLALDRPAAVKLLAPELAQNNEFRERFMRESRTAASLRHPNVVAVYDAGEHDGLLYLAMQLVEGTDFKRRLEDDGTPPVDEAIAVLYQVAEALEAAHVLGLVHRDVKPANILLDGSHAYLGDFGLSKRLASHSRLTAAGSMLGTVDYVAPEQIEGGDVDARTDVYALGCVAYECLSGNPPFAKATDLAVLFAHMQEEPPPLSEVCPEIPSRAEVPLARAMAKSPARRYPRPTEFVLDLAAELGVDVPDIRAVTHRARVAVATTDPTTQALVRGSLAALPVRVDAVDPNALPAADPAPCQVLIVDIGVGLEGARALVDALGRAAPDGERPAVLVLTERGGSSAESEPLRALADAVLGMPFSGLQLASRIRQLIGEEVLAG